MKIFCVGRNYSEHARELKNEIPGEPVIFMKPPTALLSNQKDFYYPAFTSDLHYEGELVLRLGKGGRSVQEKFALSYIDAITTGIDFTARDLQQKQKEKGLPWEIAKGFDYSAVIGDWKAFDSIKDPSHISFQLKKNNSIVQQGNNSEMIFPFEKIIAYLSVFFTLQTGDIIFTGTPSGVGPVQIGDILDGTLEGDEVLHCRIR
ncbi:MAG TPA: fumarylacetoacetate hydrolase family protein [Chitinophagaceae bacterium]|nr:fumarylacetoacetate hydrolase family protein [Chitinophagaceae bacterium]